MAVTDTAKISEAGELLKKQYRKLKEISGLYKKAERLLRSRGDGEDPLQMSQRTRELLEEELMRFSAYISFTEEAERLYRRYEKRITERYNLDDIQYRHTEFGTSHFEHLADFSDLIPVKGDGNRM